MIDDSLTQHAKSLFPDPVPSDRRGFLVTTLTAGFALAVQPVMADAITTSAEGLVAGEVKVPAEGGEMPAYRAMPAKGKGFPVVLVVHEIFGVHEYIKDVCRRFAKRGYLAIAPDLYARQGRVDDKPDFLEIRKVVSQVPDAQVMADLDATARWAGEHSGDVARLGITGFCWGGRIVWLYAAHNPELKAGVAWYGSLVARQPNPLQPKQAVDLVAAMRAPVLGLYGEADQGIPQSSIEQMRTAIKAAGKQSEIVVYPEGPHGFHADYRPSYRKEMAEDGWNRLLAWFKKYGVA
jgi:carboxymethylenebutenolidase